MSTISVEKFYNKKNAKSCNVDKKKTNSRPSWVKEWRKMPTHILGPRQFWKEFSKQADALATMVQESNALDVLTTFVYQQTSGYRKFVVADAVWYWWHYKNQPDEKKCSYEVIPEDSPCRLYLDLEYLTKLNPESDGPYMTNLLVKIICSYLLAYWGLPCNKYNVVNLDSSTEEKFSRHLIFHIKDVAFKNNYHIGILVRSICNEILEYLRDQDNQNVILSCYDKEDLKKLLVKTNKGQTLFIDTGVYTKNRHFRIYLSTKWGKQSHLTVSKDSKYIPSGIMKDQKLNIFLDSLITYFANRNDLILLECLNNHTVKAKRFEAKINQPRLQRSSDIKSKYPALDDYVSSLIHPGKIRVCRPFNGNKLIYETIGYRYCENIGRCHKHNNVYWIVDLHMKKISQRCHDEDCRGFESEAKKLPEEICFQIEENDDDNETFITCTVTAEDAAELADGLCNFCEDSK